MTGDPQPDPLLLPEETRVIHIGPPKTGTTYLQSAFHSCRAAVAEQGVHYAGRTRQPTAAVQAVLGNQSPNTGEVPAIGQWQGLVREVRRSKKRRVVISSEFLADAKPEAIETIVRDLGSDRVHVVVTLRPLARIIPSQWQQFIQSGVRKPLDAWLDAIFNDPLKVTPTFWRRHRHDELIARWADIVGPDNVTVIALDDRDHAMVTRVFERLVGLREGTLVADQDLSNRSMTMPEIEVVRAFNEQYSAEGLGRPLHTMIMRFGAATYMKSRPPNPDEARVEAPQWALDRAGEVAREMVDAIVASGVRIVGDPERLTEVPTSQLGNDPRPEVEISPQTAAVAAMGVLISSGLARGDHRVPNTRAARVAVEPIALVRVPTLQLLVVLWRRTRAAAERRTHALFRRNA
ncbi:MAG: hypothetical protein E4H24_06290 [Thermomicrobiales bacterium]|nr:MAG: hypothetical protein E4H24_06290 [Thermomicrobiales bacterium]